MKASLRNRMLAAVSVWTLATTLLGVTIFRDLNRVETAVEGVHRQVVASTLAADAQWRLDTLVGAASEAVADPARFQAEVDRQLTAFGQVLEELESSLPRGSDARTAVEQARGLSLPDVDRYVRRAQGLAENGQTEAAQSLIDGDLATLADARFHKVLRELSGGDDEAAVRGLDRKLAGIVSHWATSPGLRKRIRDGLLLEIVEARLALELGRNLQRATLGKGETQTAMARSDELFARFDALVAARNDPQLANSIREWRAKHQSGSGDGAAKVAASLSFRSEIFPRLRERAGQNLSFVESRLASEQRRLAGLRIGVIVLSGISLLLGLMSPGWLSKRFTMPLAAITEWVEDRRSGDRELELPQPSRDEIGQLTAVMRELEDDLDESSRRVQTLAFYDNVTGLPNRQLFQEKLQGSLLWAKLHRRAVAVLSLHVGSFREINESRGHDIGDELLREIASRVAHHVRLGDLVARPLESEPVAHVSRLGGSDFTLLLTNIDDPEDAGRVASRLLSEVSQPCVLEDEEMIPSASIGIAVYPMDGPDASTLIANAHVAAHHARNHSVSNFQFYSEAMNATVARKLDVGKRLHGALERDALTIHFQPIFDARSREVSSGEVLLRWTDSELGPVPPSEFIPIAEEIGLISEIGNWVIRSACEQAREWREEGYAPIRLAVNVSPLQIRDPKWSGWVAELLEETEMATGGLELEITESAIMSDDAATISTLTGFKEMGVGLALDDFGTGYSSLSYLHRYPIDRVKIDRSFVADIALEETGTEVTAAILALAQSLRLRVVAEGIETNIQAEFLAERGCDELQGFLYGKPMPAHEFEKLLSPAKEEPLA